jgi:hypothetical protein
MTGARRPRFRVLQKTHRIGRPQCLENPKLPRGRNADETERAPLQAEPERLHHPAASLSGTDARPTGGRCPQKQSCLTHRFCYRAGITWVVLVIVLITFPCTVMAVVVLTIPTVTGNSYRFSPAGITTLAGKVNAVGFELVKVT